MVPFSGRRSTSAKASDALGCQLEALQKVGGDLTKLNPQAPLFEEMAAEFMATTAPATLESNTVKEYQGILDKHILPALGSLEVTTINKRVVVDYLQGKILGGLAYSTVSHQKGIIARIMELAEMEDLIQGNPARALGSWIKKSARRPKKAKVFTPAQVKALLKVMAKKWPRYHALVATLAVGGLRTGEAVALTWRDVDLKDLVLVIDKAYRKGVLKEPKTEAGSREVECMPRLATVLADHRVTQKRENLKKGRGRGSGLVFTNRDGGRVDIDHFRAGVWKKALEVAQVPPRRINDLRHTYISSRIKRGEDLADISRQAGHANLNITLRVYAHFIPSESRGPVDWPPLDTLFLPQILPHIAPDKNKGLGHLT